MSSKRGKQKETVEEDFEAFVRHQLSSISDDLKEMKGAQVKIQRDVESLQSQIKINESSISKLKESLDTKLEVLTGQLHESNTRIDQIQIDITKYAKEIDVTYERLLSLERYSRDYNLRFYNIPESTGEDCIAKLRDIIGNDLQFQPNIENAHRIGPFKDDGTPRPILAKFLYRPERFRVVKKKRDLRDGVRVSDDLIWEDRQKKKQLRFVMKEAFEAGLLKFPDIVKLNTCMLFYDYFHHEKFPNIPISLVSELHNYSTRSASSNQVAIPSFRTNLRRFCPSIIGSFFWNDIPQFIRDKRSKKMFRKALSRWYLAQY